MLPADSCIWDDKGLPVPLPCRLPTLTDDALSGEPDCLPELLAKLLRAAMSGQEELGTARQEQAQAAEQAQAEMGAAEARQQQLEAQLEAVRRQAQVGRRHGLLSRLTCSVCATPGQQTHCTCWGVLSAQLQLCVAACSHEVASRAVRCRGAASAGKGTVDGAAPS